MASQLKYQIQNSNTMLPPWPESPNHVVTFEVPTLFHRHNMLCPICMDEHATFLFEMNTHPKALSGTFHPCLTCRSHGWVTGRFSLRWRRILSFLGILTADR
jgi:hypothetical protein